MLTLHGLRPSLESYPAWSDNRPVKTPEIPPQADPLLTEEYTEGQHVIRIEFYKATDGSYFVWPNLVRGKGSSVVTKHFQVPGHFPNMDAARQAAINEGRSLIGAGFDVDQVE